MRDCLDQLHAPVAARTKHLARVGYSGHEDNLEIVMLVPVGPGRQIVFAGLSETVLRVVFGVVRPIILVQLAQHDAGKRVWIRPE